MQAVLFERVINVYSRVPQQERRQLRWEMPVGLYPVTYSSEPAVRRRKPPMREACPLTSRTALSLPMKRVVQ